MQHLDPGSPAAESQRAGPQWFATTHWSAVLAAAAEPSPRAQEALERLCRQYWAPVFQYIRGRGAAKEDAEDLTQRFFERFLAREHFRLANQDRGRFRTFLLTAVKHFLVNERERAHAQKRGGGQMPVSLDEVSPETGQPLVELVDERTADRLYQQNWALALLHRARERLAQEYAAEGKAGRFACLEQFLPGEDRPITYAEAGARLGAAEGTVKADVHRLKARYRALLREEIANTVATPSEIEEELRHLIQMVGQPHG